MGYFIYAYTQDDWLATTHIHTRSSVLQLEIFILKLVTIDRFSSRAVVIGEISSLAHEVGNDTMERAALVAKALLART
jgi:hypothetical protein